MSTKVSLYCFLLVFTLRLFALECVRDKEGDSMYACFTECETESEENRCAARVKEWKRERVSE